LLVVVGQRHGELGPDRPVRKDMPQFDALITQDLANEESTVAVVWIPLAADQGDAVAMRASGEAVDGRFEGPLLGHRSVQRVALGVVVLLLRRATPQLVPK